MIAKRFLLHLAFLFWLKIICLPLLIPLPGALTYSQPIGGVSHDTTRKPAPEYLTLFTLGALTCVSRSSFPRLPLTSTLSGSPCCAHRWYWHMAAAFAVLANLALLLQCLFLLPSGLHSALCKCHPSPVVSPGAANLELDQLCCQWNIIQIQHNNKT